MTNTRDDLLARAMDYVQHDHSCAHAQYGSRPCDCGLRELLAEYKSLPPVAAPSGEAVAQVHISGDLVDICPVKGGHDLLRRLLPDGIHNLYAAPVPAPPSIDSGSADSKSIDAQVSDDTHTCWCGYTNEKHDKWCPQHESHASPSDICRQCGKSEPHAVCMAADVIAHNNQLCGEPDPAPAPPSDTNAAPSVSDDGEFCDNCGNTGIITDADGGMWPCDVCYIRRDRAENERARTSQLAKHAPVTATAGENEIMRNALMQIASTSPIRDAPRIASEALAAIDVESEQQGGAWEDEGCTFIPDLNDEDDAAQQDARIGFASRDDGCHAFEYDEELSTLLQQLRHAAPAEKKGIVRKALAKLREVQDKCDGKQDARGGRVSEIVKRLRTAATVKHGEYPHPSLLNAAADYIEAADRARESQPYLADRLTGAKSATSAAVDTLSSSLLAMLGNIQKELGFTDEDMMCANGDVEIIEAIRELKSTAQPASAAGEAVAWLSPSGQIKTNTDVRFDGTDTTGWKPLYLHPPAVAQPDSATGGGDLRTAILRIVANASEQVVLADYEDWKVGVRYVLHDLRLALRAAAPQTGNGAREGEE